MDEFHPLHPGFLFVAAMVAYLAIHSFWSGWTLFRSHDFSGWKLHGLVDPAHTAQAAKYFGVACMLFAPAVSSCLVIFVFPITVLKWTYLAVGVYGLALGIGYVRYCLWHRFVAALKVFGYLDDPERRAAPHPVTKDANQPPKRR